MSYQPAIVQLENHVAGDTWQGVPVIGPITINAQAPGVTAARVRMTLTRTPSGPSVEFDSDAGLLPITIVDEDTWEFTIPPVDFDDFPVTAGQYSGHLEITDASGERLTTHELRMTVLPDKTP